MRMQRTKILIASGIFEVTLVPQDDSEAPAGRMTIKKKYSGKLVGTGIGQMISKRTQGGVAAYAAIEEFEGDVAGKAGSFTLIHNGYMSSEAQSLKIEILEGSGQAELEKISGALEITQQAGQHNYVLTYEL